MKKAAAVILAGTTMIGNDQKDLTDKLDSIPKNTNNDKSKEVIYEQGQKNK